MLHLPLVFLFAAASSEHHVLNMSGDADKRCPTCAGNDAQHVVHEACKASWIVQDVCNILCVQEITHHVVVPELAFTGDTTVDFITDPANEEVFRARLLIMECTFLDDEMSVEDAKVNKAAIEGFVDCSWVSWGSWLRQTMRDLWVTV